MPATMLAHKRRRAAVMLWAERLIPALAPAAGLLLAWICAALLGLLAAPALAACLLVILLPACGGLAWWRLRRLDQPGNGEIDRRLEANAGTPHRPLAILEDRPAWAGGDAVWQAHQARAAAHIAALRPGVPHLGRPATAGLLAGGAALLLCLVEAGSAAPGLIWAALTPHPALWAGAPVRLQAWIVPPRSTELAPIFLQAGAAGAIAVPPGAQLTVSVSGGRLRPDLRFAGVNQRFSRLGPDRFQADRTLATGGLLQVWRRGDQLAGWRITVAPDQPPTVALVGPAGSDGTRALQRWTAHDDYGLAAITAELRLRERPGAALSLTLPLDGTPRDAAGGVLPDLTAQPWAGLPVLLRFVARDTGGQQTATAEVALVLPERAFGNVLARALIGVRRMLVTDPDDTMAATGELDRLSIGASGQLPANQWLNLRAIAALLFEQPDAQAQAQARLWALAVQIEDGGVPDARQRLAAARAALQDALAMPPGPDRERQVAAMTSQLRRAMQQFLQAMEQQAIRNGLAAPSATGEGGRSVDASQLLQMEQQMEQAARAGRGAEAQALLGELGALLDSLRQSSRLAGADHGTGRGRPPDPAFASLLGDQQVLRSHTSLRRSQDGDPRTVQGPERDPDEAAGQPDPGQQRRADAAAQAELRHRLGDLAGKLGEATGQVPDGLARADGAMRDAAGALGRGDDATADAAQQQALDGLRQAGQQMAQQQGDAYGAGGSARPGAGTDPLGRGLEGGPDNDDGTRMKLDGDAAASRAVRDELRRRAADRTRSPQELNYLDRLLKPY